MKQSSHLLKRIARGVIAVVAIFIAFRGLQLWNKHDFCRGKADLFVAWSLRSRAEAADPTLTPAERRKSLVVADLYVICSRKFATVASRPWLPYPSAPLVTPAEEREVLTKY